LFLLLSPDELEKDELPEEEEEPLPELLLPLPDPLLLLDELLPDPLEEELLLPSDEELYFLFFGSTFCFGGLCFTSFCNTSLFS